MRRLTSRRARAVGLAASIGAAIISLCGDATAADRRELDQAERVLKDTKDAIEKEQKAVVEFGEQAAIHRAELDRLRTEAMTVVEEARAMERLVDELEARLGTLFADEIGLVAALDERAGPRAEVLGAMARLSRTPPRALMLSSQSVVDSSRTVLLLSALSRRLESEAHEINVSLAQLTALRSDIARERLSLEAADQGLADRHKRLETLMADRAALELAATSGRSAAEARIDKLVREARSLEELVAKLARDPIVSAAAETDGSDDRSAESSDSDGRSTDEARQALLDEAARKASAEPRQGAFTMPAQGQLIAHYGTTTAPGVTAKGISIETRPDSPVVAPFSGKIVFAGPFHDYGQLLIIAHGQGYHTLLAGLGRIDSTVGRWVLEGEPVGVMGSVSDSRPQLYLELRHNGRPVNPLPWLATGSSKLSG
ncbi:MAG: hypothetical protein FJX66_07465 [Alphaproteobacteria bacterium]|nr:hypothetical protein [Alphaproteobacteria bacterium]